MRCARSSSTWTAPATAGSTTNVTDEERRCWEQMLRAKKMEIAAIEKMLGIGQHRELSEGEKRGFVMPTLGSPHAR